MGGHSDPPSTKTREVWKVSPREAGWKVYPGHPLQTCQVGSSCRFRAGSPSQSYIQGRLRSFLSVQLLTRGKKTKQSGTWKKLNVSNWGESGQWKYDKQLHKQQVPFTHHTAGPAAPPLPCHSVEYFGWSSTAASGCVAVLVSPPTSFFWPWRVSAPELESTLSTLSCDISPSSSFCRQRSETNKKSPVRSKSISQILRCRTRDGDRGANIKTAAAGETQRGNLPLSRW